jgi:hypothetical protein
MGASIYTVRLEHLPDIADVAGSDVLEYEARVEDPPSPKCSVCGHSPCPGCRDWCDTVGEDDDGNDLCPCSAEMACKFDPVELAAFLAEHERRRLFACFGGSGSLIECCDEESQVKSWHWSRLAIALRKNLRTLDAAHICDLQAERWRQLYRGREFNDLPRYRGFR